MNDPYFRDESYWAWWKLGLYIGRASSRSSEACVAVIHGFNHARREVHAGRKASREDEDLLAALGKAVRALTRTS